ncbi:IS607 family transposase [Cupriavidus sp. IDO]|uniref:IS607 family transposase n=1 Tax=Cupriavidus sp. IDO TaxID=1539142 RepID=UPI00068C1F7A|nr:IS607 family transposase [Cupriavidus sp. IDO]KWR87355.1 resolvase [Cupriavidus sp. IDO]
MGELAVMLGVAVVTLRRWDKAGRLTPACRTLGGHRRYDLAKMRDALRQAGPPKGGKTIAYARVSSHDQKGQLQSQALRLQRHCEQQCWPNIEVITDLGSGLNYKKKGLLTLLREILMRQVTRIVLVTKDRLLRFGSEFRICDVFDVEVVVLDAQEDISREQQLTEDLVEILTVFSPRLYGTRSRKNLKALQADANVIKSRHTKNEELCPCN